MPETNDAYYYWPFEIIESEPQRDFKEIVKSMEATTIRWVDPKGGEEITFKQVFTPPRPAKLVELEEMTFDKLWDEKEEPIFFSPDMLPLDLRFRYKSDELPLPLYQKPIDFTLPRPEVPRFACTKCGRMRPIDKLCPECGDWYTDYGR